MLDEKIAKAVKNYYKIQKGYYGIKKPKKPRIDKYRWYLNQLDKVGEIDYIHFCGGKDECVDIYYNECCIFHVFKDGTCLLVAEDRASSGSFDKCLKLLEAELTN